jgi:hypothetical protein
MSSVDALLFDLGRVVIDIDMTRIHERWSEVAGVPLDRHHAMIVGSEFFRRHERGEITDAEFFAYLRRELDLNLTNDQFLDGWNAIFVATDVLYAAQVMTGEEIGEPEVLLQVHQAIQTGQGGEI